MEFGKSTDNFAVSTPYFSRYSCWPIESITEMVIIFRLFSAVVIVMYNHIIL